MREAKIMIEQLPATEQVDKKTDYQPLFIHERRERNYEYELGLVLLPTQRNNPRKVSASEIALKDPNEIGEILMRMKLAKRSSERDSLCSCLITNKSDIFNHQYLVIETAPKWHHHYKMLGLDLQQGFTNIGSYKSNSFKASNNRKIKALDRFCNYYQPLYASRQVTLFLFTLTGYWTHTEMQVKDAIEVLKLRFKRKSLNVLGYIWTFEVSEDLHPHYHLCLAVERMNLRGGKLPKFLFLDQVWGARTQVDFVKKNIRNYLSQYFAKSNYRALNKRSYGASNRNSPPQGAYHTAA
jgi:hypothetical protein